MKKRLVRLDKLLVERQMLLSGTAAQSYIEEGRVKVDGITVNKSASMVSGGAFGSSWYGFQVIVACTASFTASDREMTMT